MLQQSRRQFLALTGVLARASEPRDLVAPWKHGVKIRPVSTIPNRRTIHTYFNVSPESPDGRYVLYYTSITPEGYGGEIRIQERATGRETVLVRNLDCEDAHRVACQQWISGGRRVLFHDLRNGDTVVATVDIQCLLQVIRPIERLHAAPVRTSEVASRISERSRGLGLL